MRLIIFVHQAAFTNIDGAEALVLGPNAAHAARCLIELADFGDGAPQLRTDSRDARTLGLDGFSIAHVELDLAAGGVASGLLAGAPAPDHGKVGAQGSHAVLLIFTEAAAEADKNDHRSDAPDDTKHSQEAAQLVSAKGGEGLARDFPEVH